MSKVFFALPRSIGKCDGGDVKEIDSQYIEKHLASLHQVEHRDDWKRSGAGAAFTEQNQRIVTEKFSDITGVCGAGGNSAFYSVTVKEVPIDYPGNARYMSGIFCKDMNDEKIRESHIIHGSGESFGPLDYNINSGEIVTSVGRGDIRNIGVYLVKGNLMKTITDGESIDDNPSFSKSNGSILFDSKGIARNNREEVAAYSNAAICSINSDGSNLKELFSQDKYDLVKPKQDTKGNMYYIRRPYKPLGKKNVSFFGILLDIVLFIPRLFLALFGLFDIMSRATRGKALTSSGNNPSKSNSKSERQMMIDNNMVDAERNLKKNKNEKFPGYVPRSWELVMRKTNGEESVVKHSVLDYALADDGIIVTNGRFVTKLDASGAETLLYKGEKIFKVSSDYNKVDTLADSPFN